MFKAGDVVLGDFVCANGTVLNHYSVVLLSTAEGSVLAYTTSIKGNGQQTADTFSQEDVLRANWTKPCRWVASTVSLVPNQCIRKVGAITPRTMAKIQAANLAAQRDRSIERGVHPAFQQAMASRRGVAMA